MRRTGFVILFIFLSAVIFLVPSIDAYNHSLTTAALEADVPYYLRALGEGRMLVSDLSVLQADLYFHSGAGHFYGEHKHGMAIAGHEDEHEDGDECEHEHSRPCNKAGKFNFLFKLGESLTITEHVHLGGDNAKEMIPWLYYAAKVDPHNILAYTLMGYWLSDRLGKTEEALTFLREGLKNNPDSWEINAEIGRINCETLKDYVTAVRFLERAMAFMEEKPHDKFQERYVLSFLARSYEGSLMTGNELLAYKRIEELFPKDDSVKKKIESLTR